MYYGKGIMNIQIENSIKDTPKVRNGIYLTTKSRKEGHGIGLQNVKLVVEKYHGQMEICHTEKLLFFSTDFVYFCHLKGHFYHL